ncbi:hypothetical protein ACT3CD_16830 [Geofilum sp. OHC36d9]|uniref:hypothetical protein n=1 Tax=Geofilum sp. OHC36d9 TaxID=3458413 RepID=UPI004033752B
MKQLKYILFFLLLLILQLSFANSFASVFSYRELGVNRIELTEKQISDFSDPSFKENYIFEASFLDIVTCSSISFCDGYAKLVESWKSFKNAGLDDLARNNDNLDALNKALKQSDYDAAYFENLLKTKSDPQKFIDDYVKKLGDDGRFLDNILESDYEKYLSRKLREGKTPRDRADWNHVRDYWLNDSPLARGNAFNETARIERWYPYNEVTLSNGKRVDSFRPPKDGNHGEIISRKATDLDDVQLSTFESYLNEMSQKYAPGTSINAPKYGDDLKGKVLEGNLILEIPDNNRALSNIQDYIDIAKTKNIELRFRPE